MTETRRLFIAAPVPDNLLEYFRQQQPFFTQEAVRFVPDVNLHLTIHFLGEVPVSQLGAITQTMHEVAVSLAPFTLQLERLEPGPKPKSPRLIWARFVSHPAFTKLCATIATQLALRPPDQPDYIPHVTLARFRKNLAKPVSLPTIPVTPPVNMPVNSLALWQSELKSPHPIYRILVLFPLTGASN